MYATPIYGTLAALCMSGWRDYTQLFRSMQHWVFAILTLRQWSNIQSQNTVYFGAIDGKTWGLPNMREYTPPEQLPSPAVYTA